MSFTRLEGLGHGPARVNMAIGQGPSRWEDALTLAKSYYYRHAGRLSRDLKSSLSPATLKRLHRRQPIRHFLIAARQLALLVGLPIVIYHFPNPWIWVPASLLLGFVIFSFSVLLHEVVHKSIFRRDHKSLYTWLGRLYATVSGLSAAQFTRWHLDHHGQLGSAELDPKRAYLSPKRNARWYKLLYCTPALFPIYFRAARKETSTYPAMLQQTIRWERLLAIGAHLSVLAGLWWAFGGAAAFRAEVIANDPPMQRLPEGDTQRLQRAWEVHAMTGKPLSYFQSLPRTPLVEIVTARIVIEPARDKAQMAGPSTS